MKLVTPVVLAALAAQLAAQHQHQANDVIVSAAWLAQHQGDRDLVILDVEHDPAAYTGGHIPGARLLSYNDIGAQRDGLSLELPAAEALKQLLERAGVSNASHVVVYSSIAPMASRAFFTLDYAGARVSFLDGGLAAWKRDGRSISTTIEHPASGSFAPHLRAELVTDAAWIQPRLGKSGMALIDTRSDGEYVGAGERHGMPSEGHLQGARQLQWNQLFANDEEGTLLPHDQLAGLYAERVPAGDTVVTYCFIGYRASMTYMIARALGYPTKLYDGSYEDWSRRKLPLVPGASPR